MLKGTTGTPFGHFRDLHFGNWHIKCDEESQLIAIVAIHNTTLGPALGGCRFKSYNNFDDALIDASRLAHGMSLKAAISGLPFGGGKSVIIQPNGAFDRKKLFNAFGEFIDSLNGQYITAADSGTGVEDMDSIYETTKHVTGSSHHTFTHKAPSPLTAFGVRRGIEAAVKHHIRANSIEGLHIAIQGVGSVGYYLAKECYEMGAQLTITDINEVRLKQVSEEFNARTVKTDEIQSIPCDIFAPCALSNAITHENIDSLQCKIIAGAANNQLSDENLAQKLSEKNILYIPDFMINAGGLIHVAAQYLNSNEEETNQKVSKIYDTTLEVLTHSNEGNILPLQQAIKIANKKLSL
jgi:leucine dehydrogenase